MTHWLVTERMAPQLLTQHTQLASYRTIELWFPACHPLTRPGRSSPFLCYSLWLCHLMQGSFQARCWYQCERCCWGEHCSCEWVLCRRSKFRPAGCAVSTAGGDLLPITSQWIANKTIILGLTNYPVLLWDFTFGCSPRHTENVGSHCHTDAASSVFPSELYSLMRDQNDGVRELKLEQESRVFNHCFTGTVVMVLPRL